MKDNSCVNGMQFIRKWPKWVAGLTDEETKIVANKRIKLWFLNFYAFSFVGILCQNIKWNGFYVAMKWFGKCSLNLVKLTSLGTTSLKTWLE